MVTLSRSLARRRGLRGVTILEAVFASAILSVTMLSAILSVMYYRSIVDKNERLQKMTNVAEAMLERIHSQTWYSLADPTDGVFALEAGETWPTSTGSLARRRSDALSVELLRDSPSAPLTPDSFVGLNGTMDVFYTPVVVEEEVPSRLSGLSAFFPVRYYKVEVIVTLEPDSVVRPSARNEDENPDGTDIWTAVTRSSTRA